ncbi:MULTISPECIES: helix-turn-helix domain-containing protein [unclassified Colwellia]|uniref:helix-turn-helix domain-containing protein n=2 Tax=unclassified Colwellia TaxID=196834 RepID=UPI0015F5B307|nr:MULTISPECIES: helix-turn-helix domain-containing protein [unclassified Colwellia]MBA6257604.1 helix-turn-helix domain-containing protein [Colwellia sp. MB3u-28]MBA6259361.1 helix-turn-helix domain-containing protein [Colwellia sp. MB3u-41]MBA6300683.1 helix-turn-helix domain-containing protein [Colwellia sp. MB3u-22]MBA6311418.1 helix-turn-helix domain-containing protein [Colwellia sp. MB3u-64]
MNFSNNKREIMINNIGNTEVLKDICSTCIRHHGCVAHKIKNTLSNFPTPKHQLFRASDYIFHVGDKLENLYIVKSGSIKTFIINQVGEEQILNFHGPGDLLGIDALPFHKNICTAFSLETSSVCSIPIVKLEEALKQLIPPWLFEFAIDKFKQENSNTYMLGKKNANNRVATFLLKASENHRVLGCSNTEFDLSMSRDDIGNYLGLASETVSRTLTNMKKDGCVKLDRRHITIVDTQHLQMLAGS